MIRLSLICKIWYIALCRWPCMLSDVTIEISSNVFFLCLCKNKISLLKNGYVYKNWLCIKFFMWYSENKSIKLPSGVRVSICVLISSQFPNPNCSIASRSLSSSLAVQLPRPLNILIVPESYINIHTSKFWYFYSAI